MEVAGDAQRGHSVTLGCDSLRKEHANIRSNRLTNATHQLMKTRIAKFCIQKHMKKRTESIDEKHGQIVNVTIQYHIWAELDAKW